MNKLLVSIAIAIFINIILIGKTKNVDLISIVVGLFCYLIIDLFLDSKEVEDNEYLGLPDDCGSCKEGFENNVQIDVQLDNYVEKDNYTAEDGKYPPCFRLCKTTKNIFDILDKYNLLGDYNHLLNIYSSVLCLEDELVNKNTLCEKALLNRVNNLGTMIQYQSSSNTPNSKLNIILDGNVPLQIKSNIVKYLNTIITNIELTLDKLPNNISVKDKKEIRKNNEAFYSIHFRPIVEKCLYDTY